MIPNRIVRINENISRELSRIIIEITQPDWGLVTLTDVQVSPNLAKADVYIKANKKVIVSLNELNYNIRKLLNPRLKLKKVPQLIFHGDDGQVDKVYELLEKINEN